METVVTGAAFGASLVASFMYQPHLIASQFTWQQSNMLQTFLTATGSSALAIELLRQLDYKVPPPRSWSSTGLFHSAIDGNIVGGLLLGTGMALSSSCPGMALLQLAQGIPTAPAILAGATAGGFLWSALLRPWLAQRRTAAPSRAVHSPPRSFAHALGLGHTATFLLYGTVLVLVVSVVGARTSAAWSPLHPVAGGLLIGGAQLVSLLLRGTLLGASACYEQLGDWAVYLAAAAAAAATKDGKRGAARPGTSAMLFAAAMVGGGWALAAVRPDLAPTLVYGAGSAPGPGRALAGGFLMAVGSRLAGGCSSGHGISGLALMSMPSLVTIAATFGAAVGVARCLA